MLSSSGCLGSIAVQGRATIELEPVAEVLEVFEALAVVWEPRYYQRSTDVRAMISWQCSRSAMALAKLAWEPSSSIRIPLDQTLLDRDRLISFVTHFLSYFG